MKKLTFAIAFVTICITAKAQINKDTVGLNLPVKNNKIIYTGVVEINGKTKDDLYKNAQQWFMDYFYTQKNVIQGTDQVGKIIFGRVMFYFTSKGLLGEVLNQTNAVTISVECKDNKYRYSFYHMYIDNAFDIELFLGKVLGTQKMDGTKNEAKSILINNDEVVKKAILSLKYAMSATKIDF